MDSEEEPRRGASRANSVRFDESATHGHFGHGPRTSTDLLPMRTGSGLGSHPMTERSSSHKSEGRQSSAGQSIRANSLGSEFVPMGPPPGLFILGPVPSIIRCWLDTTFSNDSLLYAVLCTGSYKSVLDLDLVSRLGFQDQITTDHKGERKIKLPVYLPEATFQRSTSRSSSPAPQLPTLAVEFFVQSSHTKANALQIFLGCDVLRARNADILFSQDRITLLDDDRNKLSIPLVRPENAALFQRLLTTNAILDNAADPFNSDHPNGLRDVHRVNGKGHEPKLSLQTNTEDYTSEEAKELSSTALSTSFTSSPSIIGEGRKSLIDQENNEKAPNPKVDNETRDPESLANGSTPDTPTKQEAGNMWGSWRRDSTQNTRQEASYSTAATNPNYQRAGRGRGMKILKPLRSSTATRAVSATQPPQTALEATTPRFGDFSRRGSQATLAENHHDVQSPPGQERRSFSSESKPPPLQTATNNNKPRSANPIGGASAFGWLNSGLQKQPAAGSE